MIQDTVIARAVQLVVSTTTCRNAENVSTTRTLFGARRSTQIPRSVNAQVVVGGRDA